MSKHIHGIVSTRNKFAAKANLKTSEILNMWVTSTYQISQKGNLLQCFIFLPSLVSVICLSLTNVAAYTLSPTIILLLLSAFTV